MPITVDESELPLLLVTFEGAPSDLEFDAYLDAVSALLRTRRATTALVLDARLSAAPTAPQRRKQAEWLKVNAALLEQYSAGTAFVIESALVRAALTAILWLQPMRIPHIVVSSRSAGRMWARARIAEHRVRPSAES